MGLPDVRMPDGTEIAPQLDLRFEYELYAGVRPVRTMPGLPSVLADPRAANLDFVLVRESTEGLFATRARGAMPSTSPIIVPKMEACTRLPAAVVAVCVPCPSTSRAERISPVSIGRMELRMGPSVPTIVLQPAHDQFAPAEVGYRNAIVLSPDELRWHYFLGRLLEADVIVDDISYLGEPMFQDGFVAQAAQDAVDAGVPRFTIRKPVVILRGKPFREGESLLCFGELG